MARINPGLILLLLIPLLVWGGISNGGGGVTFTNPYIVNGANVIGPVFPMTRPDTYTWAWVNQGATTINITNGSPYITQQGSGGYTWALRTTAVATPFTATICFRGLSFQSSEAFTSLIIRESGSGKFIEIGPGFSANRFNIYQWNDVNSVGATLLDQDGTTGNFNLGVVTWVRISDDGANRNYYFSPDGTNFFLVYTEASGTFITPNQVGYGIGLATSSSTRAAMTVYSFKIE